MNFLANLLSTVFERRYRQPSNCGSVTRPLEELAIELIGSTDETSGLVLAQDILSGFEEIDDAGKLAFFRHIATEMKIDPEAVRRALDAYEKRPSKQSHRSFMAKSESVRQELVRRLNRVQGATGRLVRIRTGLLRLARETPELAVLDLYFKHLLVSWFNRGFLVLRPINWESPAHILEKIIACGAVHAIDSWEDLRCRLEPKDRRCFAFFHLAMPDEPLIFVEVALTKGIPTSVQALLAHNRDATCADEADTAVFYSISNCQAGLASISFANALLKQVASDLAAENAGLSTFVTLSPISGLMGWLDQEAQAWNIDDPSKAAKSAAFYLLQAKTNSGLPFDPVAGFHRGNGAIKYAVCAEADISDNGIARSGGTMVNYLDYLNKVEQNRKDFASTQKITATATVVSLANASSALRVGER